MREIGCFDLKRSFGFNCLQIYMNELHKKRVRSKSARGQKSRKFVMHLLMWQPAQLVRYTLLVLGYFLAPFLVRQRQSEFVRCFQMLGINANIRASYILCVQNNK